MLDATTLPITSENTRLRPLSELDADAYAAGTKDEAVRRFGHLPESDYTEAHRLETFDGIHPLISPLISLAASSTLPILNPTPQSVSKPYGYGASHRIRRQPTGFRGVRGLTSMSRNLPGTNH